MDDNNNGVNYGPDPVNSTGSSYGANTGASFGTDYSNPNQQQPVYNNAAQPGEGSGMATAALVCGIVGLCCCFAVGIAAIILGAIARGKCTNESDRKKATAGMILGIVAVVLWILLFILNIFTGALSGISSSSYYGY